MARGPKTLFEVAKAGDGGVSIFKVKGKHGERWVGSVRGEGAQELCSTCGSAVHRTQDGRKDSYKVQKLTIYIFKVKQTYPKFFLKC